jgi:hypothetical protein
MCILQWYRKYVFFRYGVTVDLGEHVGWLKLSMYKILGD